MPKIYYRCSKCHSKVKRGFDILDRFRQKCFGGECPECGIYVILYVCQQDYWWDLLYMKIRDIVRRVRR